MLAKDIKVGTLFQQRDFIEAQLKGALKPERDGDPSYSYIGYIYPENLDYFENEGYTVQNVCGSDVLTAITKGRPMYLFTPKTDLTLSEEELQESAEAWEQKRTVRDQKDDILSGILGIPVMPGMPGMPGIGGLSDLFGAIANEFCPDSDDHDDCDDCDDHDDCDDCDDCDNCDHCGGCDKCDNSQ